MPRNSLPTKPALSRSASLFGVGVIAVFGIVVVFLAHASGPFASIALSGSSTSGVVVGSDAAAYGGHFIQFGNGSTPTSTPTPTPNPGSKNCLPNPHLCGFPDATNTGVPAGVSLKNYTGSYTITTAGTTLDAYNFTSTLKISANNVTITRSSLGAVSTASGISGLLISDSTINGTTAGYAVGAGGYELLRDDVSGGQDNVRLGTNVIIKDSYLHTPLRATGSHDDGTQIISASNTLVSHNTIIPFSGAPVGSWPGSGDPMNSVLQIGDLVGDVTNLTFTNNLCDGGNYSFNANWTAVDAGTHNASGISITNNRLGRDYRYGPKSNMTHGIVWTGNVYDDTGVSIP